MIAWLRRTFGRTLPPVEQQAAMEYRTSADALSRAVAHGGVSVDHLSYAFSRAQFNLDDKLDQIFDVSQDTHLLVQGVDNELKDHGAKLERQEAAVGELRNTFQAIGERVSQNEGRITTLEGRMDRSEEDRRLIHTDLANASNERAAMSQTLARVETGLAQFIARYDERMARAGLTEEDIPELVDFVRELKRNREGGDDAAR
jgi:chromosome segregation ATPase